MRLIQATLLVLVGLIGAMLFTRGKSAPEQPPMAQAPVPVAVPVVETPPAPPVVEPKVVEPKAVAPVKAVKKRAAPSQSSRTMTALRTPDPVISAPPAPVPAPPAPAPAPVVEAPRVVEPPAPPPPARKVTITAGTLLPVRLVETVSSEKNHSGDTFNATLDEPLVIDGFVIAERGARVEGRIVDTQQAGRVSGLSSIGLALTRLTTSDGQNIEIATESFRKAGPESKAADAAKIGGAAAIGAAIGAIAGGGKGAAIGAGVGGAAGTGGVMSTRGKPAVLPSETKISFRLTNSVTITEKRRGS